MPFDYTTAKVMTKSYSALLADKDDSLVQDALENHAIPRIRLALLTATDGLGNHILYSNLKDLSDSDVAAAAELVLDVIVEDSPCSQAIRRMAAALAASWLILSDLSVLDSQQKVAATLEKQVSVDLDKLGKSPLLKSAAIGATASVLAAEKLKPPATLYLALDAEGATLDADKFTVQPFAGAQLPFPGALDAGRASMIVNGVTIGPVTVAEGEAPASILWRLMKVFEGLPTAKPNFNLMVSERSNWRGSRVLEYTEALTGATTTGQFSYTTDGAQLGIVPRDYDATSDVIVATFVLESRTPGASTTYKPGIKGLVYGINQALSQLTHLGPHAVAVDLDQGKATLIGGGGTTPTDPTSKVSDSFFFICEADNAVTQANQDLVYQVNGLTARTVPIPAGSDANALVSLFAQDLAASVSTQRVLGASRPSAIVSVNGTTAAAPSIELVAFGIESSVAAFVVKLMQVPTDVIFGVQALGVAADSTFDSREKSVVIKPILNKPSLGVSSGSSASVDAPGAGTAHLPTYQKSAALVKVLKNFGSFH
jgi:hypothetical protein